MGEWCWVCDICSGAINTFTLHIDLYSSVESDVSSSPEFLFLSYLFVHLPPKAVQVIALCGIIVCASTACEHLTYHKMLPSRHCYRKCRVSASGPSPSLIGRRWYPRTLFLVPPLSRSLIALHSPVYLSANKSTRSPILQSNESNH